MPTVPINHFVFVDFENVSELNLALVAGKSAHVTLLIGKNQGRLDFALVEQIHQLANQVELVKLDASGRNALDLTLAYYLGRAVAQTAGAHFCIVSKDKDFEPMIAHLVAKGTKIVRCDSFAALPFLPKPKKAGGSKAVAPAKAPGTATKTAIPLDGGSPDERLEKLVIRLKQNLAPRPKKRERLLAYINTVFGGKLTESGQNQKLTELVRRGVVSIDAKDKLVYA